MGMAPKAVKRLFKQFPLCHLGVGGKAAARTEDTVCCCLVKILPAHFVPGRHLKILDWLTSLEMQH